MMKYQIGHVLKQKAGGREHTYTLTSTFQTVNRHGFDAKVLVWTGRCATCGCPFEATGSRNGRRYLIRNCPAHRRKTAAKQRQTSSGISGPDTCGRSAGEVREKCAACLRDPTPVNRSAVAGEVRGTCGLTPSGALVARVCGAAFKRRHPHHTLPTLPVGLRHAGHAEKTTAGCSVETSIAVFA